MPQLELTLAPPLSQSELLCAQIERARARGLRPASRSERGFLGPDQLFSSAAGGPLYVRISAQGEREDDISELLARMQEG